MERMENDSKITIIVAEDHTLMRESLCLALRSIPDYEVVGEAGNEFQAIDTTTTLKPDFIFLDITSPNLNGLNLIGVIKKKSPDTKILLLSLNGDDDAVIIEGLKAGAKGYLSKNSNLSDIKRALTIISNDEMWVERKLVNKIFENDIFLEPSNGNNHKIQIDTMSLTTREQDVLRLLVRGSTNKEIARDLYICEKTVKSHLNRIFRKLNVSRRLEAILYAIKSGMV